MILNFTAKIDHTSDGRRFLRFTDVDARTNIAWESYEYNTEEKLLTALDPKDDEEVVAIFFTQKRRK